jgi:hypothetical protein
MFATDLVTANGENGIRAFRLNFVRIRWQWMGFSKSLLVICQNPCAPPEIPCSGT